VRATAKTQGDTVATVITCVCAGLFAFSFNGCADISYVKTNHASESRYDIYHGPDYYPYYPYYSYYGGAYYYGY